MSFHYLLFWDVQGLPGFSFEKFRVDLRYYHSGFPSCSPIRCNRLPCRAGGVCVQLSPLLVCSLVNKLLMKKVSKVPDQTSVDNYTQNFCSADFSLGDLVGLVTSGNKVAIKTWEMSATLYSSLLNWCDGSPQHMNQIPVWTGMAIIQFGLIYFES